MAQHDRGNEMRDGGRRSSRGGQGGAGGGRGRRNDARDNPNNLNIQRNGRATPTGPMSPPPPRPASTAPTPAQTPTPTLEIPSSGFNPISAPFDYVFLTDDRVSTWDSTGHKEVTQKGRGAVEDEDTTDLSDIFQELIRAALDGRMDPASAGRCIKEILGPDTAPADGSKPSFDAPTAFLDILSMVLEVDESPNISSLRSLMVATGISPNIMRQKLDNKVLSDTGLTRETFSRMSIRQATNQLYRQANYNLLREETEGYSKLVTELFTTSGSEPPSSEVVEDAFERVKGLIGTFDLDVGRVLDITLDVFASVLIKQFRFFVKFLRVSSWWPRNGNLQGERHGGLPNWALPTSPHWMPTEEDVFVGKQERAERDILFWDRAREVGLDAFFELGGRHLLDEETKTRILASKGSGDRDIDGDRDWIEQTGTLPPSGNRVAAQLLGFKLRFYTSAARDEDDTLPPNLIYLTALLIKIGFISLRDLYPHLWPFDDAMPALREKRAAELAEKERLNRPGGGLTNALANAGALTDDTVPGGGRNREAASKSDQSKAAAETEGKSGEPEDQKVQLLTCLLTIGAIPEALFMLGRFPWLPEAYPDLMPLLNRIIQYSIKDVYDQIRPQVSPEVENNAECPARKVPEPDQSGVAKGQVRLTAVPTRSMLRWPFPDKYDTNANINYRFYWEEWADNVPVCRNVDDLFILCNTFLNLSGVSIGKDATLLTKLARIGNHSLQVDRSQQNFDRWKELLKRLIVPALSMTVSNSALANEIYDMLSLYPIATRYSIYAEWYEGPTSRQPAMKIAFARAKLETLSTMKRISKINVVPMARALGKITHHAPGIVFNIALSQIEAYTNLTEVVVECGKQFTPLGYDVLVWSLMSSLGAKGRNRNNAEFALLPSAWLMALSRFSGKVYKRYSHLNLVPILRYINDQIYRGNSTDLVILKELIAQMSGIVPDLDYNDAQIVAMTGGELLKRQTLINLQDKRFESTKTSKRLMNALTNSKLAGELLISIAQYRQAAIFKISDTDAHIKLLATIVDDTQAALTQYLELLRSNLTVEEFDASVPGIPELLTEFGLDPALAFLIGRPSLAHLRAAVAVSPISNGRTKANSRVTDPVAIGVDADGDVGMDSGNKNVITGDEVLDLTNQGSQMPDANESSPPVIASDPFNAILEPIISSVQTALPDGSFKYLTPNFYTIFWSSSLGDLAIPELSYNAELARLLNELKDLANDRSDMSRLGMAKKEEKKKALNTTREKLFAEFKDSVNAFTQRKARLLRNKALWFPETVKPENANEAFFEKCLLPRLLLSPGDAEYSFKMIRFIHDNSVPYFRTLQLYGQIFRQHRLRAMMFTCTVREAENLGRFLKLVLMDLSKWHKDGKMYEKEAWGAKKNLPGFAKILEENSKPKTLLSHDEFKGVLLKWHRALNSALRDCFEGTEWMHIRNAITVLKSIVQVFPAIDFQGAKFLELLEGIAKREKGVREDLALTGNAVFVQLKKREPSWVMIQAFGAGNINYANGKPPVKSVLKPTAPDFKPKSAAISSGAPATKPLTSTEVEDGEVDDAKLSARTIPTTAPSNNAATPQDFKRASSPAAALESKKSELLEKRELFKAQQAKAHESTPPRPVAPLRQGPVESRPPNSLPSRPDVQFPGRDLLERHPPRHGDRRDGRDPRLPDPRLDRSRPGDRLGDRLGDRSGDRLRDFSGNDRRVNEPTAREFARPPDRSQGSDRERVRPDPPPRWSAESAREKIERSANAREADTGRLSREMPPPRPSAVATPDRTPQGTPHAIADRVPAQIMERQDIINPERAALISTDNETSRSSSPRRGREEILDRVSSRPQSPRRHGADKERPDLRRDDRQPRSGPPDMYRSRVDDIQPPPAGPRSDRPAERERGPNDRANFRPTPPRTLDPDHGRLNSTSRSQPDPNFGRLVAPSTSDIPSGPRDRSIRGGRMGNVPPPSRQDGRTREMPRPPTPEKQQPPTGPSGRLPRRSASGQIELGSMSGPAAAASPTVTSPSASTIHPDRLKHLGASVTLSPVQPPPSPQLPIGVHPDRLRAFSNEESTNPQLPPQTNKPRSRPDLPPLATPGPPSGPKINQSSPINPPPSSFAAPTGPASANERATRGGRRQLAGINTMLQQGAQQNTTDRTNIRGRGGRMSGMGHETLIARPSTPSMPVPPPPPGPPPLVNPARADLITGPETSSKDHDQERNGRRERSGRSRRSSRSPGRERDSKRASHEDERPPRSEHRDRSDRRTGEREPEKDRHQSRLSPAPARDLMAGRDSTGGRDSMGARDAGRDGGRERERGERESRRRDGHRDSSGRDPNVAGWNGERGDRGNERGGSGRGSRDTRNGDMRNEEHRRDGRGNRDDGSRKRRSDGEGLDSRSHNDKRVRRG
ncbi:hypothetical protein LZ554_005731 [Drepanopeziza brunnea f. sp. 'monogermtubi']|nr:hypothetical protein LZ554_005731 [Drepanopeziza brunnea f. sp. 'monogermtubi']